MKNEEKKVLQGLVNEVCGRIGGYLTMPLTSAAQLELAQAVATYFGTTVEAIYGNGKHRHIADARHVLWFIRRTFFLETFQRIADDFGRDYSTVIQGVRVVSRVVMNSRRQGRHTGLPLHEHFLPMTDVVSRFNEYAEKKVKKGFKSI